MSYISRRITYGVFRKTFIFTIVIGFFLVIFYFYHEKYENALNYIRLQKKLHPQLFRNASEIYQPKSCTSTESQNEEIALIFIPSSPQHQLQRQIIRSTWGKQETISHLHFRVIFIVEEVNDGETITQMNLESVMFGDIVRTHFIDSYSNPIYKTMIGFQWALKHCSVASFIIKINDDVFVNPFALRQLLDKLQSLSTATTHQLHTLSKDDTSYGNVDYGESNLLSAIVLPFRENVMRDLKFIIPSQNRSPESQLLSKHNAGPLPVMESNIKRNLENINDWNKTIFCFVWHNTSRSKKSKPIIDKNYSNSSSREHPTYCSDVAYILPLHTAATLVNIHLEKTLDENIFIAEGIYVTGFLAAEADIDHVQIATRYAFNTKHIESIINGDTIFTHLGKDMEALTNYLWNRIIQEQFRIKSYFTSTRNKRR